MLRDGDWRMTDGKATTDPLIEEMEKPENRDHKEAAMRAFVFGDEAALQAAEQDERVGFV